MKLYGSYTSPFVRHCRIALAETEQDYEFILTDHSQSQQLSATAKVPFLDDGELRLNDSVSILRYVREQAGESFCADIEDFNLLLMVNTALDAVVNTFLLSREGIGAEQSQYLARQYQRIESILDHLEQRRWSLERSSGRPFSDGQLRLGCFLSWGVFRERIDLSERVNLRQFLLQIEKYAIFADTDPHNDFSA
ncbi:glutathione S-transferase family protein [Idiomarina xiamenensis]|uniref:Glutathione S-transferase domain-containing protein n=1 Tax=Idiomarina xiamenensis 10-D-4 TaxID=740709 RepID=K2J9K8_9GAMM|nr:glutathione S-transferase family protein [Idiomarina xiamenensis]EKE79941.1 glutathione S-transferase domain-containing protein [Idiomarina xiamenensis 10-D-4]